MITLINTDGQSFTFDPTESWDLIEDGVMSLPSEDGTMKLRIDRDDVFDILGDFMRDGHRPLRRSWKIDGEDAGMSMEVHEVDLLALGQAFVRSAEMATLV